MQPEQLRALTSAADDLLAARETLWINPGVRSMGEVRDRLPLTRADIEDAEARLARFAPFIARRFPETAPSGGLIESPLTEIPQMKRFLNDTCGADFPGRLFLKEDSRLPISVKARGGIYEVLKTAETLARAGGLLQDDYTIFDSPASRDFFRKYALHVGSTGNLGLSIGIMGAAIGFRTTVHMSADARQWKKDLLRARGAAVVEYADDYSRAVREGRKAAAADPCGYFVDDENSRALFLGYATAALRLQRQLTQAGIPVSAAHPLIVCIPCGVGGAPCGITFGLKQVFGDHVCCLFAEPVQAPCMLLGLATGLHDGICVQDIGLTGVTAADGLAVGRPSAFAGRAAEALISGIVTVRDASLFDFLRGLWDTEGIFIEPSACAAFRAAARLREWAARSGALTGAQLADAACIVWATGGSMVPAAEREAFLGTHLS